MSETKRAIGAARLRAKRFGEVSPEPWWRRKREPASDGIGEAEGRSLLAEEDEDLMLEVRNGSRGAFETLFARYRDAVWRFFRRRTADAARAEELAQDTFVAVLEGARRYERRGSFRSYLFGAAYNVLMADRRRHPQHAALPLEIDPAADGADPDAAIWVRDAIATLDPADREVLMLREYEQLSYQEIADLRGIPLNTVRSQLFRARLALKTALESSAPETTRTNHALH